VYALLSQSGVAHRLATAVATPQDRSRVASELVARFRQLGAQGLVLEAASVPDGSHAGFVKLLYEIRRALKQAREQLIVVVPRDLTPGRFREVSAPADFVLLNLFKDASEDASAAPLAAQGWFEAQLARHAKLIDPGKLIVGLGALAVEWDNLGQQRLLSLQAAWDLARENRVPIELDAASLNPTFAFRGIDGRQRTVWALDAVTAFNQTRAALAARVAGIAINRMGLEDRGVWSAAGRGRLPDRSALPLLEKPLASPDAFQRSKYDVLRTEPGRPGVRTLQFNDGLGLITAATLKEPPVHVEFSGLHATATKAVALTFDDGPDPVWTPKILDVLAAKGVKATFYIIGANAARYPEIVHRLYAEGHDIGNHSYSHRNMFNMSRQEIAVDLNGVQRLLEAEIGVNTILFRAPYAISSYREFISAPLLMSTVSELGYLVGGIDVETYDYLSRNPAQVHERVMRQVLRANASVTVLMHDGGGRREPTVEALGPIIDDLRSHGFSLVTTHELVGLKRDAVMPRIAPESVIQAASTQVRGQYMITLAQAGKLVHQIAIVAALLAICRLLLIIVAAHVQRRRELQRAGVAWTPRSIAVLVPGYNEEKVICKTVQSLLDSTIADRLEIIVIDDGSTDRTSEIVAETFADRPNVKAFKKANGGKSAALNFGITKTEADVIVAIDADTMLEPDAIELLVRHFHDERLGAVAGNAVVGNQCNMITRMQALEYVTSQNLERRALEIANAIPVVPGAIGAWRRAALLEAGGYGHDTLAEDADLTIELERLGWKVIYEPRARALTEAPETLAAFLKQRFRWMFGTLQVAYKNLVRVRGLPARIALITIPNAFVFSFAFTLLAPIIDAMLLVSVFNILFGDAGTAQLDSLNRIAVYWLLFQAVDLMVAFLAIRLDCDRSNFALLPWILVQRFTYRQLLYWVAFRALLAAVKGQFVGWGKLIRTGTVALASAPRADYSPPSRG
jgi:cellulose synthase/poly-beta-1,6-N-acetylglucosamine synthase-like glycosyltransferase/peptidoglycan/xylan/chitin deacetylase (PgdA/CDA1 family)